VNTAHITGSIDPDHGDSLPVEVLSDPAIIPEDIRRKILLATIRGVGDGVSTEDLDTVLHFAARVYVESLMFQAVLNGEGWYVPVDDGCVAFDAPETAESE